MGEAGKDALRVGFDRSITLEFRGAMSLFRVNCTEQSLIGYDVLPQSNRGPRRYDMLETPAIKQVES